MVKVETVVARLKAEKVGEIKVTQQLSRYRGADYKVEGQVKVVNSTYDLGKDYNGKLYADRLDTKLLADMGVEVDFSDLQKEVDDKIAAFETDRLKKIYAERDVQYDNYLRFQMELRSAGISVSINKTREQFKQSPYSVVFTYEYVYKNYKADWSIELEDGRYKVTKHFDDYKTVGRYGKIKNLINKISELKQNFDNSTNYKIAQDERKTNSTKLMVDELKANIESYSSYDNLYKIGEDYNNRIVFKSHLNTETNENKYTIKELPDLSAYQMNKIIELIGLNK